MKQDEQLAKNLDRAHAFLLDLIEHPEKIDAIEDGAAIVHMPSDDPDLRRANEAMARRMAAEGVKIREAAPGHQTKRGKASA
jgi:hypothetical protein